MSHEHAGFQKFVQILHCTHLTQEGIGMTQSQQMLANLIGSRICHDLISPIGAIHNGIKLLILTAQDHSDPEVSLIADSCKTAPDLIKFFLITFGKNGEGKSLSALMAQTILEPLLSGERKSLQWNI